MLRPVVPMIAAVLFAGCGSRTPQLVGDAHPLLEFRLVHDAPGAGLVAVEYDGSVLHLDSQPVISDTDIVSVADPVEQRVNVVLGVELSADGAARLARVTARNTGSRMALLIDGQVVSAVVIRSAISGSRVDVGVPRAAADAANLSTRVRTRWPEGHDS